jgi:hypothetical protein
MRRRAVLLLAVAAALTVGGQSAGSPATKPSLRVVDLQPFTVRGEGFAVRERVRLNLYGVTQGSRRVVANGFGAFVVTFPEVRATRCDLIRMVAVRSGGRVWLKRLPSPACHTGIGVGEGPSLRDAASGVP